MTTAAAGMTSEASDLSLLGSYCRLHDGEAFDGLVDRYEADLLRLASAFLADEHAAMDAVQDTLIALARKAAIVWQQAVELQRQGSALALTIRPWLYRVVRNACIDRIRRRRGEIALDDHLTEGDGGQLGDGRLPEQADQLWAQVDALSPLQRAAVLLRYREQCSYQDIADQLGKSVNHVGVLLNKALARLRESPRVRALDQEMQP